MKKIIIALLSLVLLVTAVSLTMTSCSKGLLLRTMRGDAKATYFFAVVNENAARADSFTMEQTMLLDMEVNGMDYEQTTVATVTNIGRDEDMSTLTQTVTEVVVNNIRTVSYNDYGYADGVMFLYSREEGSESKLKSPITVEEYEGFIAEQNHGEPGITVGEGYSDTMTCVQNSDKTWTATYENFTEEGMIPFYRMLAGVEYMVTADHTLSDVRLTCTADEKLYLVELTVEYLFEENPEAETEVPEVRIDYRYDGWNHTVLAEPYDVTYFHEVEDVRYVERFLKALRDRETAEAGSFDVKSEATAQYGNRQETEQTNQKVTFNTVDGYRFTLDSTQLGSDIRITYQDGRMTTSVYDSDTGELLETETDRMPDYEAQATVQQLMNNLSIRGLDIVDVKLTDGEKGIYRYDLGSSVRRRLDEQYYGLYGAHLDSFSGYIEATIVDGKLVSYTFDVYCSLELNHQNLSITTRATVTFHEQTEEGEAV